MTFDFLNHLPLAEGYGINTNIFETNVINLAAVVAVVVSFVGKNLSALLDERKKTIFSNLEEANLRAKEAQEKLAFAKSQLELAQKKAKVVFHPITFIGAESIIAANAAACAADENKFVDMNLALFQNQGGSENSGRWQGDAMLALGDSIGIKSDSFKECVREGNYVKWTRNVTDASASKNVNSTPTIRINGKDLDRNTEYGDPVKFKAALAAGGVK